MAMAGIGRIHTDVGTPEVAVLDFAMPAMNGAVLAQHIAARLPSLPIVFASGYADTAAIKNAAGRDAIILQKPFSLIQLISALKLAVALSENGASYLCDPSLPLSDRELPPQTSLVGENKIA